MEERRQSEQIIAIQSLILIAVATAGYMASDSIIASLNAINDPSSYVTMRTENAILTDNTKVDLTYTESIVNNFRFICLTTITIAVGIALANLVRILKRNNNA